MRICFRNDFVKRVPFVYFYLDNLDTLFLAEFQTHLLQFELQNLARNLARAVRGNWSKKENYLG